MLIAASCYDEMINATARSIKARVELYDGSTLLDTYTYDGALQSYVVERVGDGNKFFGFGVCQKLTVKLRDKERTINITKGQGLEVVVGVGCEYLYTCPIFFVEEIKRDENTNELTVTAYDAIYRAAQHTVKEVIVPTPYTIEGFANACGGVLGMPVNIERSNLVKYPYISQGVTSKGITYTVNNDGSFYANGTSTDKFSIFNLHTNMTLPAGTYSFDFLGDYYADGTTGMGCVYDGTNYYTIRGSFTLTETTDVLVYFQVNNAGVTFDNVLIKPMIVKGKTLPTQYSTYNTMFDVSYDGGANFEGSETVREALDDIAEATGTIYYMNNDWELVFRRLDRDGAPVLHISKDKYFTLKSESTFKLETVTSATELGDNVTAATGNDGETQFLRDNPFLDIREDVGPLLVNIFNGVRGLALTQFDCKWRGNFLLEIGDKVSFEAKDGGTITSYLLNDTMTYNGGLVGHTQFNYQSKQHETASNPATLGEAIRQTYAKVDKVNKRIEMVASEVDASNESVSSLQLSVDSINASVTRIEQETNEELNGINGNINTLTQKVEASMTAEDVQLQIKSELSNGVDKVTTSTGFKFDQDGLTVSKSNSEMSTIITEDGMTVYRNSEAMLVANNEGVNAANLHATTYLIVGANSRFEDYGENRTGCFYIGG